MGNHHVRLCTIEARHRLLQGVQPTGAEVVKAAAYLAPKGGREQEHAVMKAERGKYLSRVGQKASSMVRAGLLEPQLCGHACVPGQGNAWYYRACGVFQSLRTGTSGRHHTPTTHRWCGERERKGSLKTNQQ
jgi:hypothetical protein